jgi:hypothetical protein
MRRYGVPAGDGIGCSIQAINCCFWGGVRICRICCNFCIGDRVGFFFTASIACICATCIVSWLTQYSRCSFLTFCPSDGVCWARAIEVAEAIESVEKTRIAM